MKNLVTMLVVFLSLIIVIPVSAQSKKEIQKELKEKASKDARKQAKRLKKDGFTVAPGQLPMDKQIESTMIKRFESDDEGNKLWFVSDARAVGETHSAAKMQAYEVAKLSMAGQIGTEVKGLMETTIANSQLDAVAAESITQTIASAQSIVAARIGRTTTLFEADRRVGTNTEIYVTVGYSYNDAMNLAKDIIGKELKEKAEIQAKDLEQILDF